MNSALSSRIDCFRMVRDEPYAFDFVNPERDRSCRGKSARLTALFRDLGLQARQICCRFRWEDTHLPQSLTQHAPSRESQHWYVQVRVLEGGDFIDVDPTFDAPLKHAGFPVVEWDGLTATPLAVTPFDTFSPERSNQLACYRSDAETMIAFRSVCGPFYTKLNHWVASQRCP